MCQCHMSELYLELERAYYAALHAADTALKAKRMDIRSDALDAASDLLEAIKKEKRRAVRIRS